MRPEIRSPVTRRPAPHRRFVPRPAAPDVGAGLYPGEPEACRRNLRQFLPVLVHLGLLLAVFHVYQVEGRAFQALVTLALAALPVHYLLPFRWKKPLFVAVSIVGLVWVFGAGDGGDRRWRSAAVLIGVCYLPIALGGPRRDRRRGRAGAGRRLPRPAWSPPAVPDDVWAGRSPRCSCSG